MMVRWTRLCLLVGANFATSSEQGYSSLLVVSIWDLEKKGAGHDSLFYRCDFP